MQKATNYFPHPTDFRKKSYFFIFTHICRYTLKLVKWYKNKKTCYLKTYVRLSLRLLFTAETLISVWNALRPQKRYSAFFMM